MTGKTERVELTIQVAESVVDLSMSGVPIECASELVAAATTALLTVVQRERRDQERERVRPDDAADDPVPAELAYAGQR